MTHRFDLREYAIFLGPLENTLQELLGKQTYSSLFLIADRHTAELVPPFLDKMAEARIVLEAGEIHKTLRGCTDVWQAMLDARLDRQALTLNFGGGVVGDLGGFCAATFKRGIRFVQIPTTLLAMTDAAVGGKLAVDFHGVKNTIGVFQNPAAVLADPVLLQTLPERELRSGFAEVIKHALIGDPALWELIQDIPRLEKSINWTELLKASIAVKVQIVEADPLEKGLRSLLNFGHTIGHALESYFLDTAEPLTHGEAVAIGMLTEYWLAYGENTRLLQMIETTGRFFAWRTIPPQAAPALWLLMQQDKKNLAGAVRTAVPATETGALRMAALQETDVERALGFYRELAQQISTNSSV
jgi:3-dehydroquinate synthase